MNTITLRDADATRTLEIVRDLRVMGLVQGTDFDFAFYRKHWDPMTGDMEGFTKFTFYTEKWASWFALKYAS